MLPLNPLSSESQLNHLIFEQNPIRKPCTCSPKGDKPVINFVKFGQGEIGGTIQHRSPCSCLQTQQNEAAAQENCTENTTQSRCHHIFLTYTGLFKGNPGGSFPQSVDCCHVHFVGEAGEDLRKMDTTAILVVRVFLHLQ